MQQIKLNERPNELFIFIFQHGPENRDVLIEKYVEKGIKTRHPRGLSGGRVNVPAPENDFSGLRRPLELTKKYLGP